MRLTLVIVTVIFTALLTYAKLMSMASEPVTTTGMTMDIGPRQSSMPQPLPSIHVKDPVA